MLGYGEVGMLREIVALRAVEIELLIVGEVMVPGVQGELILVLRAKGVRKTKDQLSLTHWPAFAKKEATYECD